MKIVSWNVNSLRVRMPHLLQWLEAFQPDVVALQETKSTDDQFPTKEIEEAGYQVAFMGQKTYNGVAIMSKFPINDVQYGIPDYPDEQKRVIAATINGVRIIDVYVPNGQSLDSEKYQYKLDWLRHLKQFVGDQIAKHGDVVLLGDFNIAPEDRDVHDPAAWKDQVLCSEPERNALGELFALGMKDSFRLFEQSEKLFSWWDYRAMAFRRNMGLRIDLVLVSDSLASRCKKSGIDKEPRKWERPSDHAPAWIEIE